ncbi:MAG: glycoside hydrolase family 113 [bacterium]
MSAARLRYAAVAARAFAAALVVAAIAPPAAALNRVQCGVCYPEDSPGYGSLSSQAAVRAMSRQAVEWIQVTPYGYQRDLGAPGLVTDTRAMAGLACDVALARSLGMKIMMKPYIWNREFMSGKWPADIRMTNESDWEAWFQNYETFILTWARFSQSLGLESLCVGAELSGSTLSRPDRWREVIRKVRDVYDGEITYAANWHGEFLDIAFWDAFDYLGVQFFYPLSKDSSAALGDLIAGARTAVPILEEFSTRWQRQVLFTEVGYRAERASFIEPWAQIPAGTPDLTTQRIGYEAVLSAFPPEPWFAGLYFWEYEPNPHAGGPENNDFTPQNKPAEKTMASHYRAIRGLADGAAGVPLHSILEWIPPEESALRSAASELLVASRDTRAAQVAAGLRRAVDAYNANAGFARADEPGRFPLFAILTAFDDAIERGAASLADTLVACAERVDAPRAAAAVFHAQLGRRCRATGRGEEALRAYRRSLAIRDARVARASGDAIEIFPHGEQLLSALLDVSRQLGRWDLGAWPATNAEGAPAARPTPGAR